MVRLNLPGYPSYSSSVVQEFDLRHFKVHFRIIIDFPGLGYLLGSLLQLGEAWRVMVQKFRQILLLIGLPYTGQYLGQLAFQWRRGIYPGLGSNRRADRQTCAGRAWTLGAISFG